MKLPTPVEIRAHLDEYVIGQEDAKKVLAVALYNHYKRVTMDTGGVELKKSNILMVGPTGSGKTHIVSTLAKMLDVPFLNADSTSLLGTGVRGIEEILTTFINTAADGDVKRAETGIIFMDEVDKLASRYNKSSESIQQALLKTIEGAEVNVLIKGERKKFNTTNILFVVGGAFVGLEHLINDRVGGGLIGITITATELIKRVIPDDFALYGLIPELLGRLPVIVGLEGLTRAALLDILTKPKDNLVAQYRQMFAMDKIELIFTEDSLDEIAKKALTLNTGARGLRTIIEASLRECMYDAPEEKSLSKVVISREVVAGSGKADFEYRYAKESFPLEEIPTRKSRETNAALDF